MRSTAPSSTANSALASSATTASVVSPAKQGRGVTQAVRQREQRQRRRTAAPPAIVNAAAGSTGPRRARRRRRSSVLPRVAVVMPPPCRHEIDYAKRAGGPSSAGRALRLSAGSAAAPGRPALRSSRSWRLAGASRPMRRSAAKVRVVLAAEARGGNGSQPAPATRGGLAQVSQRAAERDLPRSSGRCRGIVAEVPGAPVRRRGCGRSRKVDGGTPAGSRSRAAACGPGLRSDPPENASRRRSAVRPRSPSVRPRRSAMPYSR